jgi:hypothetical protein
MAKKKATAQTSENGEGTVEKVTNKMEAVRRALQKLGKKALPTEIQDFVKTNFGLELTTKLISVYKTTLTKKSRKRGRPRKGDHGEVSGAPASAAPSTQGGVTLRDLRTVKEMRDRLGVSRLRELVDLLG